MNAAKNEDGPKVEGSPDKVSGLQKDAVARDDKKGAKTMWLDDYEAALAEAETRKVPVMLLITNSHSCGFCIKLNQNVLSTSKFERFAKSKLVLLKVDYGDLFRDQEPRAIYPMMQEIRKKSKIPSDIPEKTGWPYIVIISDSGKVMYAETERAAFDPKSFIDKYHSRPTGRLS